MELQLLVTIFITAIIVSAGITPLVLRIAAVYGLYDNPDTLNPQSVGRKIHSRPTPRLGGIPILTGFLISFFIWKPGSTFNASLLLCSLCVFLLGILDDITPISARLRFILQIAVCSLAVASADLVIQRVVLFPGVVLNLPFWVGFGFSTFVIVGAINALNMIDGLDGLAGGVSIISMMMLSYLNFLLTKNPDLLVYFSLPIIGAVIGFLKYNTHPATIFMGDSGSNWLGFIIGVQILMVMNALSSADYVLPDVVHPHMITMVSVIMCFALPVLDTAFVIFSRLKAGLPPMKADKRHFHHSLVQIGLSQSQSVTVMYFLCILAGTMGLAPLIYPRYPVAWVPFAGAALIFVIIGGAMVLHIRWRDNFAAFTKYWEARVNQESPAYHIVVRSWERVNKYCLFTALAISPVFAGTIPSSIGYVAIPVVILLVSTLILRSKTNDFFESLAIALACFTLVAANNQNPLKVAFLGNIYTLQPFYNSLFAFLFVSSIGFLIITFRRKHLILNASDFLMLSFPLLLTMLPEDFRNEFRIEPISLKCLVVYLCYRTLEKRRIQARRHIRMGVAVALAYLIAISLLGLRVVY